MTWEEARGECELYGGWLTDLRTRKEQNCLLRYAQTAGVTDDWYWHDGNQHTRLFPGLLLYFIIVNSLETHGVFMHAKDNSEAEWVNDWSCATDGTIGYNGYDYVMFGIFFNKYPHYTGFWCCNPATIVHHFICESLI